MSEASGRLGWRRARPAPSSHRRTDEIGKETERPSPVVARLVYLLAGLYALTFAILSILGHESFNTNAFDLGNMDQAVWNTSQGRWFEFTNWEGGTSRLAAHVEPILIPISLLYHLYSDPKTLLVLQSVLISFGALPAFWLARDKLKNDFAAVIFASAYLLSPALEVANLHDFHPVALSSAFLLLAFYFIHRRRYLWFLLTAIVAMSTKEHVPLTVALMGLYIIVAYRRPAYGLAASMVAGFWLIASFVFIIPSFNPMGISPYFSRYDHLGGNPGDIVANFINNPSGVLAQFVEPAKVEYVNGLLFPLAFLPLLSPFTLALALPDLGINILSNWSAMWSGTSHYGAVIVPFLVISAIYGTYYVVSLAKRLSSRLGIFLLYVLASAVLVFSLKSYREAVFLPLTDHLPQVTEHNRLAQELIARIPQEAGVSAGSTLNPHVSQRQALRLFASSKDGPGGDLRGIDYIFLDVTASPHPVDTPSLRWRLEQLLAGGQWGIEAARDGYLLMKRGAKNKDLPPAFYTFARVKPPESKLPLKLTFGGALRLLEFSLHPGTTLHGKENYISVSMHWQVLRPVDEDYLFVLYTIAGPGRVIASEPFQPATTWLPTSEWKAGETIKVQAAKVGLGAERRVELWLGVAPVGERNNVASRLVPAWAEGVSPLKMDKEKRLVKLADLKVE
ncbi:MAG: DUF2079 domain-containing protein [Chloroflexi bacterium]|nr:DUF2079 domain-containing protein [Chloroflexota bacterium]